MNRAAGAARGAGGGSVAASRCSGGRRSIAGGGDSRAENAQTAQFATRFAGADGSCRSPGRSEGQHARLEGFSRRVDPLGRQIALAQTLLKLACPGVPDIYQGDEWWSFNLVDPDNRRPVEWGRPPDDKQQLVRAVLAEGIEGEYEVVEAGDGVCAFRRGRHLVAVPLRPGADFEAPRGWSQVVPGLWSERR